MRHLGLVLAGLAVGFGVTAAWAVDVKQPATLRDVVEDEGGKPVAGAKVTLRRDGLEKMEASAVSDAKGVVEFRREAGSDGQPGWAEEMVVEKEGYLTRSGTEQAFAGAVIDQPVYLDTRRVTTIHVRGPKGEPAAGVAVALWHEFRYVPGGMVVQTGEERTPGMKTDEKGDYQWVHGPIVGAFKAWAMGEVAESADQKEVTITLDALEMERAATIKTLQGKLLLPDGSAAKGWLVSAEVERHADGGSNMGIEEEYMVGRWEKIGADGVFSSTAPGKSLVVVSPEGLPMVYAMNPESWGVGVHALALTVPGIEKRVTGLFVDEGGKAIAGMRVAPDSMEGSGGNMWRVYAGDGESSSAVNSNLKDGPVPGQIVSDENGCFSIPVYWGMEMYALEPAEGWYPTPQIGKEDRILLKRYEHPGDAEKFKDITLVFVDDAGKVVAGPGLEEVKFSNNHSTSSRADSRGLHHFVDSAATEISVTTGEGTYKSWSKTFEVKGTGDERIEIRMSELTRNKPVRGTVVDAAGKAVAGAEVAVFDEVPRLHRTGPHYYPELKVQTDAQGKFEMPAAPDDCKLQIFATETQVEWSALYAGPVEVTADKRDVEFKLAAARNIKVLLPAGLRPGSLMFRSIFEMASAVYDAKDHSLNGYGINGTDHIRRGSIPGIEMEDMEVKVTPGQTTVVDLRNRKVTGAEPVAARQMSTVAILLDGKPVSGAEVAVFRDECSSAELAKLVEQWRNAKGKEDEQAAANALWQAGGAARDYLDALKGDADFLDRARNLRATLDERVDGLKSVTLDLADELGEVRFATQAGRDYVVAARVRGKYVGWTTFQAAEKGRAIELTLKGLEILAKPPETPGLERRGIKRLISGDAMWQDVDWGIGLRGRAE